LDSTTQGSRSVGPARTTDMREPSSNATGPTSLLPTMCARSTRDSRELMCSLVAFHVKTSPLLATVLEFLSAPVQVSGVSSLVPFAYCDRELLLWRTSQGSLLPASESSSPIWPKQGMTHAGAAFEPPISERLIDERESSWLLPTPASQEPGGTVERHLEAKNLLDGAHRTKPTFLSLAVKTLLPTPGANDMTGGFNEEIRGGGSALRGISKLLPGSPGAPTNQPSGAGSISLGPRPGQLMIETDSILPSSNGCSDSPTDGPIT
jgi:hypothetical protein